jgi:hypothetical protein
VREFSGDLDQHLVDEVYRLILISDSIFHDMEGSDRFLELLGTRDELIQFDRTDPLGELLQGLEVGL